MTRIIVLNAVAVASLGALADFAAFCPHARASDWVVLSVTPELVENLDVMSTPNADIVVGYGVSTGGVGGDMVLSWLPTGRGGFDHRSDPGAGNAASCDVDRFGNVFYASRDQQNSNLRAGQDFRGFGGLLSSVHPHSPGAVISAVPTMAVDQGGLPAVAGIDQSGARFISRFNLPYTRWETEVVDDFGFDSPPEPAGPNSQALAFDMAGNAALCYVQRTGSGAGPLIVARQNGFLWSNVAGDTAAEEFGTSLAASPDGSIGFVYVNDGGELTFGSHDGMTLASPHTISSQASHLTQRSLAFDPEGNPAIVYSESSGGPTFNPLHLARRDVQGQWTDEILPASSQRAGLTFDTKGDPLIAACTPTGVELFFRLLRGDFDLNEAVEEHDADDFVQALRHQTDYLASHLGITAGHLLPLGDYDENGAFENNDARTFADSLAVTPVPGLANRKEGYVALDQADADPALGDGDGNFFNTMLATPKSYKFGDSRGDLSGLTEGQADGTIDAVDIDYLFSHLDGSDLRVDLNGDGIFLGVSGSFVPPNSDAAVLVEDILGTFFGDANLDGEVTFVDFLALRAHFGDPGGWSDGNFNSDSEVTFADFLLLRANFDKTTGAEMVALNTFAANAPEPSTYTLLLLGGLTIWCWKCISRIWQS